MQCSLREYANYPITNLINIINRAAKPYGWQLFFASLSVGVVKSVLEILCDGIRFFTSKNEKCIFHIKITKLSVKLRIK